MAKGQSTFDYMILTGVILVVIVPLLFFSTERIDQNRLAELQDALGALKDGITQVNNLGFGTSSVVVVRVPKGVTYQSVGAESGTTTPKCKKGMLCYKVARNDLTVSVPADVDGILPMNEGLHYVTLFNNGTHVLLYECGNNKREAFEQCDGTDNLACDTTSLGCASPAHPDACKCFCDPLDPGSCAKTTGRCDPTRQVCVPCFLDSQCLGGKVCLGGRCVDPVKECTSNSPDCGYPTRVCNKQRGECEACDIDPKTPYPPWKDCEPGDTCISGGFPSYCGKIGIGNQAPNVNAGPDRQITLPQTQVNLDGTVTDDGKPIPPGKVTTTWEKRSGPGTVTFGNKNSEKTTATFSDVGDYVLRLTADDGPGVGSLQSFDEMKVTVLSGGLTVCGNGKKEGLEECEFDPLTGEPLPENCDYQPKLFRCTTKDTGTTKGCRCVPNDPKNCGDGLRSDNEECDVGNANWGTQGTCGMGKVCSAGCVCQPSTDYCGDGTISTFPGREQCDFMAPGNGGCPATKYCTRWCSCRPKYGLGWCGDGKYQAGFEECEPNVVGCMDIPGKILLGCRADCRCDYRDTTPPDRPDPEGNPRQKCEPTQFCLYASCAGDCPPAESCGASGSTCGCVKDVAQPRPCLRSGGTACNPDGSCKTGYQCDKLSNCCEPLTGIIG